MNRKQDDGHITKRKKHRRLWFGAAATVLVAAICLSALWPKQQPQVPVISDRIQSPDALNLANLVAAPKYPEMAQCPNWDDYTDQDEYNAAYDAWLLSYREQYAQPEGYADSLDNFFRRSIPEFLSGEGNRLYSPVNVYLATAMLAEISGGNSRQQILDLLGADSIDTLRAQAGHVWNAHYCNDGQSTTLLANSLWLDENHYTFKEPTIQTLAHSHQASVFHGDLASKAMIQQLQSWINSQTGNLLAEQAKTLDENVLNEETVLALISTALFSADWTEHFSKDRNTTGLFHCEGLDRIATFMNQTICGGFFYYGNGFEAVRLELTGDNAMWLILPDEGKTVDEVLESGEYWDMIRNPDEWQNKKYLDINLSLPKFDITGQNDLIGGMKNLGITDVFDPNHSNFSPMIEEDEKAELRIGKIDHAARVAVDEDGVIAAAYTIMILYDTGIGMSTEEIDFTLDRPFLFAVTSRDELPLFAGVVEQP